MPKTHPIPPSSSAPMTPPRGLTFQLFYTVTFPQAIEIIPALNDKHDWRGWRGGKGNGPTTECTNLHSFPPSLLKPPSARRIVDGCYFPSLLFCESLACYLVLLKNEVTTNQDAQTGSEFSTPGIVRPHCLSHPPGADHRF